jgi:hypothetical protein
VEVPEMYSVQGTFKFEWRAVCPPFPRPSRRTRAHSTIEIRFSRPPPGPLQGKSPLALLLCIPRGPRCAVGMAEMLLEWLDEVDGVLWP